MTEPASVRGTAGQSPQAFDSTIEASLMAASMQIGGIAEMAPWATAGLAARIRGTGKAVSTLTVGELLTILDDQYQQHRYIFEGKGHE